MIALIIIGAILLLIFGICAIRATVTLEYRDELTLAVSVLGIKIGILPKKEKKVDVKKYSAKRFRKLLEKRERDEEKKRRKKLLKKEKKKSKTQKKLQKAEKDAPAEPKQKSRSVGEIFTLVSDVLSVFFSRFAKHFRVKLARLNVTVASEDAAKTAILYGVAAQGVAYILEILDRTTNLEYKKDSEVNVFVDYLGDTPSFDISIAFSMRVWHLLDILFRSALAALRNLA